MLIKVDFTKTLKHIYLKHKMIMLHEQKHTAFTRKTQLFASEIKFASLNEIQLDCILAMLENIDIIPSVA